VKWEVFVEAAKGGDEVIFEGSNCSFGSVAAMSAGRNQVE
jgi:hypothetical protein